MDFHTNLKIKKTLLYILFFINLIIVGVLWWHGSGDLFLNSRPGMLIALGRVLGLISEYLILVQLVLIGRITPVEKLYGFDVLAKLHRQLGKIIPFILTLHPILLIIGYASENNVSLVQQFLDFWNNWQDVAKAVLGFLFVIFIVVFSLVAIRKKLKYETWHGIHLLVYVAIFLFFGHQINTADVSFGSPLYYWLTLNFLVFGLVLIYRFLKPLYFFVKYRFYVEKVVKETPDVYSVYIKGRNIEKFSFVPGQFANIFILGKGFWQPHPFSFSISPGKDHIRFSIKESGDFTKRISKISSGTPVLIDGPLGAFTAHHAITDKYLLIAGGIGITPIRSMAEALSKEHKDAKIIYGVRTSSDIALDQELSSFGLPYHVFFSQIQHQAGFASGIIDMEKIRKLVPDFKERDIYVCGPTIMLRSIVDSLISEGMPRQQIHYEIFAFN